jgi:hypothetical protein
MALAAALGCAQEREPATPDLAYEEHLKDGALSLTIIGDYFNGNYILELLAIAQSLSPRTRQIIICTEKQRNALSPFLQANNVSGVEFVTCDSSAPIRTQWARDIILAARGGRILVPPNKHAATQGDAETFARFLQGVFPDRDVRVAPFAFETGNLAFVNANGRRVLITGKKVIFDNEVYQRRQWAAGYDERSLLSAMQKTFEVDTVLVVGRVASRPPTRLYFEYHIDMGMVILRGNRAVVSRLRFGDGDRAALDRAVATGHPIVTPFLDLGSESHHLPDVLAERLRSVAHEYDDYAALLDSLGLEVHRSPVGWQQVLGSMSWTNVIQFGNRVIMPLYPDSLHGVATGLAEEGGQLRLTLDVSGVDQERFELTGGNEVNYEMYRSLGYEVDTAPEYLHYMMGGIHCFINIVE